MLTVLIIAPFEPSSALFRAQRFYVTLNRTGHKAWIACPNQNGESSLAHIKPISGGFTSRGYYRVTLNLIYDNLFILGLFLFKRFKIVQFCLVNPLYFPLSIITMKAGGAKIIYDMQDPLPENWVLWRRQRRTGVIVRLVLFAEKIGCSLSDQIIVVSNAMRRLISRSAPDEKMKVIFNTIMNEELETSRNPHETLREIFPHSLVTIYNGPLYSSIRGIDLLVTAASRLGDVDIKIVLVGEDKEGLSDLARRIRAESKVLFLGMRNRAETLRLLTQSDLLVMPYPLNDITRVAASTKMFEAMALGIPILTAMAPGAREVLGESAFYYNWGTQREETIKELAAALRHLASNRSELEAKSKLSKAIFDQRFRWAKVGKDYLEIIDALGGRQ